MRRGVAELRGWRRVAERGDGRDVAGIAGELGWTKGRWKREEEYPGGGDERRAVWCSQKDGVVWRE